jgi:hypothetical protein
MKRYTVKEASAIYRSARAEFERLSALEDAAFVRWFVKRREGVATNGAAAVKLGNLANYASAEVATAEGYVYRAYEDAGFFGLPDFDAIYKGDDGA